VWNNNNTTNKKPNRQFDYKIFSKEIRTKFLKMGTSMI
jgi:hypothetical protein